MATDSSLRSIPRAGTPAWRIVSRNSPRPQPISSTFRAAGEIGKIELLAGFDVLFRATEPFGETAVIEGQGSRRSRQWASPCGGSGSRAAYFSALADGAQFGMDQALVLQPDAFHVRPQTLLHLDHLALERAGEILVLGAHQVAVAGIHQGDAVL